MQNFQSRQRAVKEESMERQEMPKGKDHAIYTNTAVKIKKINVAPKNPRGGRRL